MFDRIKQLAVALPDASWISDPWGISCRVLLMRADHPEVLARSKAIQDRTRQALTFKEIQQEGEKARLTIKDPKKLKAVQESLMARITAVSKTIVEMADKNLAKLDLACRIRDWEGVEEDGKEVSVSLFAALRLVGFAGWIALDQGELTIDRVVSDDEFTLGKTEEAKKMKALPESARKHFDGVLVDGEGNHLAWAAFDEAGNRVPFGGRSVGDAMADWLEDSSLKLSAAHSKAKEGAMELFDHTPAGGQGDSQTAEPAN